jgi:initiation factor 1A
MVKNDAGGNKGKGLARKHVNAAKGGASKQLRVATDEAEKYAVVGRMLGNGMCYVRLLDGSTGDRLCIIRNKFKGRGKRDNILDTGSWVLVGLREWSSKQDTCDLLEVYNAAERDRLMKNEACFKTVAEVSASAGSASSSIASIVSAAANVQFADSSTMKYSKLVKDTVTDSDDDVPMQQRVYDMPPSSDDDDDTPDDDTQSEDEAPRQAVVVPKAARLQVDVINVDDI